MKSIEQIINEKSVADLESKMAQDTNIYQIYNAFSDPVIPNPGSLVTSKAKDLAYTEQDFNGMSAMDLGCSMGFFSFQALNLGASKVVGIDLRDSYVSDLNAIAKNYETIFPKYQGKMSFKKANLERLPNLTELNDGVAPDILMVHSLIHWFFIARKDITIHEIIDWMYENCQKGIYFEGCVSAAEQVMIDHKVSRNRLTEEEFLYTAKDKGFKTVSLARMSYNNKRIKLKLIK